MNLILLWNALILKILLCQNNHVIFSQAFSPSFPNGNALASRNTLHHGPSLFSSSPNERQDGKQKSSIEVVMKKTTSSASPSSSPQLSLKSSPPMLPDKITSANTPTSNNKVQQKQENSNEKGRRKIELFWCGRDACEYQSIREKVIGVKNEIQFDDPATGQVMYSWNMQEESSTGEPTIYPSVLMLVKRNDDELLKVAADAVRELTAKGDIDVMLMPEISAKFKHYFGVDNDRIKLYDPKSVPGFGGNHLPPDDIQHNSNLDGEQDLEDDVIDEADWPDLICTLGGDGLLMYANTLFPTSCPPILCVAGGSLGFLTPFSRGEMVDAIRASLGLNTQEEEYYYDGQGEGTVWQEGDMYPSMQFLNTVSKKKETDCKGNVKFGTNNQICLSMRMRLECKVYNQEGVVRARFNVLNEVVIDRGSSPYLAALECFCDDVHLTTVQADGVIFSTPTGSTAYSMAAGGSVVHPAVPAILVTPICPHVLSFRSMVFPDHVILRCYVPGDARADAAVAFDGKYRRELHRGDSVEIKMSSYPVPTINRMDHSADWLNSLKRNFNFNTRARQNPL